MVELQAELRAYREKLPGMLTAHDGQYVVIKGDDTVHYSSTYEQALEWAYTAYGLENFFVKKVAEDQDIAHFARDLGPCRRT